MKDSSVIQLMMSNPALSTEVKAWVDGWPEVSVMDAEEPIDVHMAQLVVLDWDTYAASDAVAQLKLSSCPWIVVSDQPSIEQELQVLAEGGADYLRAPFDPAVSRLRINIQLNRKQVYDKLESLSVTDTLTGLYNRRKFDEELIQCWKQGLRQKASCSLIMVDVDHFKLYNDQYGHMEGDKCLQTVAKVLSESAVRPRDLVARIGGEEFALLLPDTPESGAKQVAERILSRMARMDVPHEQSELGMVTLSLGVSEVLPQGQDMAQWQRTADQALYQAKRNGRNQMSCIKLATKTELQAES